MRSFKKSSLVARILDTYFHVKSGGCSGQQVFSNNSLSIRSRNFKVNLWDGDLFFALK